ncbi:hypothetical protein M0802_011951 [Mischocyttarus mexicanus]|nr:hypothetical protein M0802_011951 [Mischocyttarus mexicanus]
MEKPYAVVRFSDEENYSEIPCNWILNHDYSSEETMCKWPPHFIKNVNFRIKYRITPSDDWPTYKIEIIGYYDTLPDARKAAEELEYSSAVEKPLGRGKRPKKPTPAAAALAAAKRRRSSDFESSSDVDASHKTVKQAAPMPVFISDHLNNNRDTNTNTEILTKLLSDDEINGTVKKEDTAAVSEPHGIYEGDPHDLRFAIPHVSQFMNIKTVSDKIEACLTLLGTISVEIKDLKQRLMANSSQICWNVNRDILTNIRKELPLNTQQTVTDFDTKLSTSKDYHQAFVTIIKQIGGINGEDHTKRVLNTIFSPLFAKDNTWEGKFTKFKVKNLIMIKTCEDVILQKFPTWDSAEFSKTGSNWFRLGNQRAARGK